MKQLFTYIFSLLAIVGASQNTPRELLPYWSNGKFIFCDNSGKQLIHQAYDFVEPFNNNFAVVSNNSKFGIINNKGIAIVPLQFYNVYIYRAYELRNAKNSEGIYFSVNSDSKFYSYTGKLLTTIPDNTEYAMMQDESFCSIFSKNNKFGYLYYGDTTIAPIYDYLEQPCRGLGLFIAKSNAYYGIISQDNDTIIPFTYPYIGWNKNCGVFELKSENQIGICLFDYDGKPLNNNSIKCGYSEALKYYQSRFLLVKDINGNTFYIDMKQGKELRK